MQSIIVRFPTFTNRSLFYRNHKITKPGARIILDLTKDCYNLLVSARKNVRNCLEKHYVYAGINCRLKVKLFHENYKFFKPMEELNDILSNASKLISYHFFSLILFSPQTLFKIFFVSITSF